LHWRSDPIEAISGSIPAAFPALFNGVGFMRILVAASLALAAFAVIPGPASAGGDCGRGKHCYKLVKTGPTYGTVDENVLVAPARRIRHHVPAVLREIDEQVIVRPERAVARHIPAEYGVVHERVMTHAGGKQWVMKRNAHGHLVGCWVKTHPTYATVARRVLVRPASVAYETIPAVVRHRTRRVVVEPARTEVEHIPAQYETRHRRVLVSPGSASWQPIGSGGGRCSGRGLLGGNC
jgi:hypothetical protein